MEQEANKPSPPQYDGPFKINLAPLARAFVARFGKIQNIIEVQTLNVEQNEWLKRLQDGLFKIVYDDAAEDIFQLEVQKENDGVMVGRMMTYCGLNFVTYKKKPRQIVLYIGEARLTMQNELIWEDGRFTYEQIDIRDLPAEFFLDSETPELWAYAYLTAKTTEARRALIVEVTAALARAPIPIREKDKAFAVMLALAPLRHEEIFIQEIIEKMAMELEVKFEHLPFYQHYQKQWLEQGKAEGKAEGIAEGETKAKATMIRLIAQQTGQTPEEIAQITGCTVDEVRNFLANQSSEG